MQQDEPESLAHVFASEGGYTNHPADPGGPTNFGITIIDARKYGAEFGWVANPTIADIRAMPKWFAEKVYDAKYWDALRCDDLPAGLDYTVVDYGINSGVSRSAKVLQRLCGVKDDGRIGPVTLAAVAKRDPVALIKAMNAERLAFLRSLKTWPVFGKGWGARVASVTDISLHMAAHGPIAATNVVPLPTPRPAPADPMEPTGKAVVPMPAPVKAVIGNKATTAKATGVAGAGGALAAWDWIAAHPYEAGAAAAGAIIVIGGAVYLIERHHQSKQDAPTPGIAPVPALAA